MYLLAQNFSQNLILNEPAGQIAKVIVTYSVQLIVKSWDDPGMNPRDVTEPILECLRVVFHLQLYLTL